MDRMTKYHEWKEMYLQGRGCKDRRNLLEWACGVNDWEFTVWLVLHCGEDPPILTRKCTDVLHLYYYCVDIRILKFILWQGCVAGIICNNAVMTRLIPSDIYDYIRDEFRRTKILIAIYKSPIHKDLWREVAGWM